MRSAAELATEEGLLSTLEGAGPVAEPALPLSLRASRWLPPPALGSTEQESKLTSEASQQEALNGSGMPGPQSALKATPGENRIHGHLTLPSLHLEPGVNPAAKNKSQTSNSENQSES